MNIMNTHMISMRGYMNSNDINIIHTQNPRIHTPNTVFTVFTVAQNILFL